MGNRPRHRPRTSRRPASTGQRGSTLLVIFLLLALMAALAMAVLLSTRSDVRVSGTDRERQVAFSAAEAGLVYGKDYLMKHYSPQSNWTPILTNPQATAGIKVAYDFGGVQSIPTVKARYTFSFRNNASDPSGSPTQDNDGRLIIVSIGEALDSAGTNAIARVRLEMEVSWSGYTSGAQDYAGQANQDVTGAARNQPDTSAVDMTKSTSF